MDVIKNTGYPGYFLIVEDFMCTPARVKEYFFDQFQELINATPTIYIIDDVVHYCVANMPGAVPYTSTVALTNVTLPYVLKLANMGWRSACKLDRSLEKGLNVVEGEVVFQKKINLPANGLTETEHSYLKLNQVVMPRSQM